MLTSDLKLRLRTRELIFGSWVSFAHPSSTEIFASHKFGLLQALKNEQSPSGNNPKEFLLILRFHKQHLEDCQP
jgi:2-keto-3-deoxy-L-rhamnonate aldolase RhmA